MTTHHIIDAKGQTIGRVASQAASWLRGKKSPTFLPHQVANQPVKIINASHLKITSKRLDTTFHRYSGYPGGLKTETLGRRLVRRGPDAVLRQAIRGMLPANRLRRELLRQLTIEN